MPDFEIKFNQKAWNVKKKKKLKKEILKPQFAMYPCTIFQVTWPTSYFGTNVTLW